MDTIATKYAIYDAVRDYNTANSVNYNAQSLNFADGMVCIVVYRIGKRAMMHISLDRDTTGCDILSADEANDAPELVATITALASNQQEQST